MPGSATAAPAAGSTGPANETMWIPSPMHHGKHRSPTRHQTLGRVAITTGAIATVAGLSFGFAVPAQAETAIQDETVSTAAYTAYIQSAKQSMTVAGDDTAGDGVTRDTISATAQSTLQAQAAAAAQAAEEAANVRGAQGYTGGIIPAAGTDGAAIIAYAQQFVGVVPYVDSPSAVSPSTGFECDSFVDWVFAHTTGQILPRGVDEIAALGTVIPESAAVAGDLVVYPGQHIGIYAGGGMMIDAPAPGQYVSRQAIWGDPEYVRL